MAIDTNVKRGSMLTFSDESLLPIPNGAIDQGDRQTFLGLYSGILSVVLAQVAEAMMNHLLLLRRD